MSSTPSDMPETAEDVSELFAGAMPKEEIGALRFLKEHPQYDGRGVVIAIFDTGVDPGAAGLSTTTEGKPKILDVIDCTGSGDVDTSAVVRADASGCIVGASGAVLKLNPSWTNPSGDWHVGCKHVYQLFSKTLVNRIQDERRKQWDQQHRAAVAAASAAVAALDKAGSNGSGAAAKGPEAAREKAELEARLTYLKEAAKSYEDHGPLIECVVWHDGSVWRAALDTTELAEAAAGSGKGAGVSANGNGVQGGKVEAATGALADFEPMTDYKLEHRYSTFSFLDSCNFCLNIYDQGNTLSIVVDCGAHGTHVAGITAAHFPDDPAMNGIAPGAQVISCKIGDTRLGSMETGTGLTRALIAVLEHRCSVINMSYGEPTSTPNMGRFVDLANQIVYKHGVIFVASAGNAGPALSTVGAPGGTASGIYGIGAYVSQGLAEAGHSVREGSGAGRQYTWSSRGPTADGHLGVAFSAPGGAISPVPTWTLQKRQLMNGTSMASPNACGGIALILSGLKQQAAAAAAGSGAESSGLQGQGGGLEPTSSLPVRVRRALEATCLPLGGDSPDAVLTYGRGLIQVDAAFEYLQRAEAVEALAIRYDIGVVASGNSTLSVLPAARGVYLRQARDSARPASYTVTVTPVLHDSAPNSSRLAVEDRLVLEPSHPDWVSCPSSLLLHHSGRSFEVRVDACALPAGLHYTEVCGYDASARWRGPLFRVPITVIKPLPVPALPSTSSAPTSSSSSPPPPLYPHPNLSLGPLLFSPGTEHRVFVDVPEGATWAEIALKAGAHDNPKVYLLRATQLQPQLSYRRTESSRQATLSGSSEFVWQVPVVPGCTMELTFAQFWSSLGPSSLEADVAFHGVLVDGAGGGGAASEMGVGLALDGSAGTLRFVVKAPLRSEKVKPEAKLTAVQWGVRPCDSALEPLATPRDTLPEGRVLYRLVLSYKLAVQEAGKYQVKLPSINKHVYDGALESQMTMTYDAHKRLVQVNDIYPEYFSLKKGDYTVRLMLRHDSAELLEKLTALTLVVCRKLDSQVSLPIYAFKRDALTNTSPVTSEFGLRAGDSLPLFLGPLADDKLPKDATPGRTMVGTLTLGQILKGSGAAPTNVPITYIVPPPKPAAPAPAPAATAATTAAAAGSNGNGSVSSNGSNGTGGADKNKAEAGNGSDGAKEKEKDAAEKALELALRDAKIKFIKDMKLSGTGIEAEQYKALYSMLVEEIKAAYPGHLPLLQEHLKKMDSLEASVRRTDAGLRSVVAAADEVLKAIDERELACVLAVKCPEDTPEAKKVKSEMEEKKAALVDALQRKCGALLELEEVRQQAAGAGAAEAVAAGTAAAGAGAAGTAATGAGAAEAGAAGDQPEIAVGAGAAVANGGEVLAGAEGGAGKEAEKAAGGVAVVAAVATPAPAAAAPSPAVVAAAPVAADEFQQAFTELRKWVDTAADAQYALLHAKAEARAKRYVGALQVLDKGLADDGVKASHKDMQALKQRLLKTLGFDHMEKMERAAQHVKFPKAFQPF